MTTHELLEDLSPGDLLTVKNEPFSYVGRARIVLEGGEETYWLYSSEGGFFSVNPQTEEVVLFTVIEEEVEADEESMAYRGEVYEFSYEDHGTVAIVVGRVPVEEGEELMFKEYETEGGEVMRVVVHEETGEQELVAGAVLVEEDILRAEE